MKKYLWLSSAAVVVGAWRVKDHFYLACDKLKQDIGTTFPVGA